MLQTKKKYERRQSRQFCAKNEKVRRTLHVLLYIAFEFRLAHENVIKFHSMNVETLIGESRTVKKNRFSGRPTIVTFYETLNLTIALSEFDFSSFSFNDRLRVTERVDR